MNFTLANRIWPSSRCKDLQELKYSVNLHNSVYCDQSGYVIFRNCMSDQNIQNS